MDDNSIQKRIKYIIDEYFKGNTRAFCKDCEIKQSTINSVVGSDNVTPSGKTIYKILNGKSFKLNSDWLMLGEGEILRHDQQNDLATRENVITKEKECNTCSVLREMLREKDRRIETLLIENAALFGKLDSYRGRDTG